jgi:hypothetical protein
VTYRLALLALLAGALLLSLLLVGCDEIPNGSPGATTPAAPSGVRGTVILGPTCPGGEPGTTDPVPCLTPYSAQLVVLDGAGAVVTRVTSDADGHFELDLPPGDYVITPLGGDPFPIAQPISVVVRAGEYLAVQINYDTGIR